MTLFSELVIHREFTVEAGYQSAEQLLTKAKAQPDAILCASYTLFEGFLQFLKTFDTKRLTKIKLATFDDHPLLDFLPFKVNSVCQDAQSLGKTAFNLVYESLQGKQNLHSVVVPSQLIVRDL